MRPLSIREPPAPRPGSTGGPSAGYGTCKCGTNVETDTRRTLQETCPVCNNLFQPKSELYDRRPLKACDKSHTICADCWNECSKRPDGKCPTCGDNLLSKVVVQKVINELIANCASVLEISDKDIELEEEPFASGAFGKVYKAKWGQENVVVKVIKEKSEEAIQAAKCEANLTLRLNHHNVIKLFGITYVKPKHKAMAVKVGIVMETAEHGSLDKWIGKIDERKGNKIALGIIDGLEYIHKQKVIHRDLKPKNILMCGPKDDMIPKIADFGVAKVIQTAIATHTSVGEYMYMAPEVRLNSKYARYDFKADIYSLAMTLFEIFNEEDIEHVSDDVVNFIMEVHGGNIGEFPESSKVPLHLRNVIVRGWNNDPNERPALSEYRSRLRGKIILVSPPVLYWYKCISYLQGRSQYEARRSNCLVLFSCSTIRLTSILSNVQVATSN